MNDPRTAAQQALGQVQEFKRRWWLVPAFGNNVNKATREAITSAHSPIFELEHALRAALAQQAEPQDAELSAALGWPGGISNPVLDRKVLLQKVAALAQQAEPVAYIHRQGNHWEVSERHLDEDEKARGWTEEPLYAAPPQRKPLSHEEIVDAVREADLDWQSGWTLDDHEPNRFTTLARAVERAHGIGKEK